jgi:hypothetical protein
MSSSRFSHLFDRKEQALLDLVMFLIGALVFASLAGLISYCAKSMNTNEEYPGN